MRLVLSLILAFSGFQQPPPTGNHQVYLPVLSSRPALKVNVAPTSLHLDMRAQALGSQDYRTLALHMYDEGFVSTQEQTYIVSGPVNRTLYVTLYGNGSVDGAVSYGIESDGLIWAMARTDDPAGVSSVRYIENGELRIIFPDHEDPECTSPDCFWECFLCVYILYGTLCDLSCAMGCIMLCGPNLLCEVACGLAWGTWCEVNENLTCGRICNPPQPTGGNP